MKPTFMIIFFLLLFICITQISLGKTTNLPEWFRFEAALETPPELKKTIRVVATLTALIGDLEDVQVFVMAPPDWSPSSPTASLERLFEGTSQAFRFSFTAKEPLPNGSIQCMFTARVPKKAIKEKIQNRFIEERDGMIKLIDSLPDRCKGFADIAFALFPEEGFYPLSSDMWLFYHDKLAPQKLPKGPVLYRNSVLSPFQAQTDVEMYERLRTLLASDPKAKETLETAQIDLAIKRSDYLAGLYVLAFEDFSKGNLDSAIMKIEKLKKEILQNDPKMFEELEIAGENLKAICFWEKGNKKQAENALRDIFYKYRKNRVQRYTLRNIGLLHFDRGDTKTAKEMFRLALELKPQYSLLADEFNRIGE